MRFRSIFVASVAMAAGLVLAGGLTALAASSPAGTWGKAMAVPSTSALNGAAVDAVSCAPHGACTTLVDAGQNDDSPGSYMVTEQNGGWGRLVAVPGLAKIAPAGQTMVTALSCPKPKYCLVAGIYAYGTGDDSVGGFTIWESNGKWGTPAQIPGLARLNTAGLGLPAEVACASTSTCVVSGMYAAGASSNPALSTFVAQELRGRWKNAIQVPGLPRPSSSDDVGPAALSCPSVGNCVLGLGAPDLSVGVSGGSGPIAAAMHQAGRLTGRSLLRSLAAIGPAAKSAAASGQQARAAIETGGTWQRAQNVGPAVSGSNTAVVTAVACPATGKCVLAGRTSPSSSGSSFVVTQSGKTWSRAARFTSFGIGALACPAAGGCVAGGQDSKHVAAIMQQKSGRWGGTKELPSATDLSDKNTRAQESEVDFLVCPTAGNCAIGGSYSWNVKSDSPDQAVFVGGEANGAWAHVRVPAGIAALNTGLEASFTGLSCASAANCAAGGDYANTLQDVGAFLIAETPAR